MPSDVACTSHFALFDLPAAAREIQKVDEERAVRCVDRVVQSTSIIWVISSFSQISASPYILKFVSLLNINTAFPYCNVSFRVEHWTRPDIYRTLPYLVHAPACLSGPPYRRNRGAAFFILYFCSTAAR